MKKVFIKKHLLLGATTLMLAASLTTMTGCSITANNSNKAATEASVKPDKSKDKDKTLKKKNVKKAVDKMMAEAVEASKIDDAVKDENDQPEVDDLTLKNDEKPSAVPLTEPEPTPEPTPEPVVPSVTDGQVIGSLTLPLYPHDETNEPSNTNAQLACNKINGYTIQPGETFSYSNAVGMRTPENGYVQAHVIGGWDYGGGVCKISSALYNAAKQSGCTIVERHPHSSPVDYMPAGTKDAAINYPNKDLRFKNTLGYPISISATYDEGGYHISIIAHPTSEV